MKYIVANWKMHGSRALAKELMDITPLDTNNQIIICPPYQLLDMLVNKIKDSSIAIGAQDCSEIADAGNRTGDVSARMLRDIGCEYVIIGHYERKVHYSEYIRVISKKLRAANDEGLIPIVCFTPDINNFEFDIVTQLSELPTKDIKNLLIAFEPAVSIGKDDSISLDLIQSSHVQLKEFYDKTFAKEVKILYGGGVNSNNSEKILSLPAVDGIMIGQSSLNLEQFKKICKGGI